MKKDWHWWRWGKLYIQGWLCRVTSHPGTTLWSVDTSSMKKDWLCKSRSHPAWKRAGSEVLIQGWLWETTVIGFSWAQGKPLAIITHSSWSRTSSEESGCVHGIGLCPWSLTVYTSGCYWGSPDKQGQSFWDCRFTSQWSRWKIGKCRDAVMPEEDYLPCWEGVLMI